MSSKPEKTDVIDLAWVHAAGRTEPCPDPAYVTLAALRGPGMVPDEVGRHLSESRCLICEGEVAKAWLRHFPREEVLARAAAWNPNSVLGTVLTDFVPDWQAVVTDERVAQNSIDAPRIDNRERFLTVANRALEGMNAVFDRLLPESSFPAVLAGGESTAESTHSAVRDLGPHASLTLLPASVGAERVPAELDVSFAGLGLNGKPRIDLIILNLDTEKIAGNARVLEPGLNEDPIRLEVVSSALDGRLGLAIGLGSS